MLLLEIIYFWLKRRTNIVRTSFYKNKDLTGFKNL
jgi:hypothetical protein